MRGFFRGSSLSVVKNMIGYTSYFTNLENLKKTVISEKNFNYFEIREYPSIILYNVKNFSTAALSKSVSNIICSPINVLKTRFEVVGDKNPKLLEAFIKIY